MDSEQKVLSTMAESGPGSGGDRFNTERSGSAGDKQTAGLNGRVPFSSKLCNMCVSIEPRPPICEFGFSDYCIGDSSLDARMILYMDGCVVLSREDFRSFEPDCALISPPIIRAWARTLNHRWGQRGTLHACMDLVIMDVASFEDVMDCWRKWLTATNVDLSKCQMVFIPARHKAHTFVLVVNFIQRRLHCFDTGYYPKMYKRWEGLMCVFSALMFMNDDYRGVELKDFEFVVTSPIWATPKLNDCGMFAMQVMECFNGTNNFMADIEADEKCLFLGKRLTYCTRIAISKLNEINCLLIDDVAKHLKRNLDGKAAM